MNCFFVRKESRLLGITGFLVACQNGGVDASKTGTTDPNTAFAEYGARTNTPAGPTGNVSPRTGSGFSGGPGAHGGSSQSGLVWLFNDASTDPVDLSLPIQHSH